MSMLANGTKYYETPTYVDFDVVYLPDISTILVEATGGNVVLEMSMNTPAEIAAGAPSVVWYPWYTVTAGSANRLFTSSAAGEYGPNAVRLNLGGNTAKMWIKG